MPTHKVKGGYKWGKSGKVYPTKKQADKQGQAIYASGWRENKEYNNNNLYMKQIVKLTENDLHKLIKESVKKVLKENTYTEYGVWDLVDELKQIMNTEDILIRLIARISPIEAKHMLEDILSVEGPDYSDEM